MTEEIQAVTIVVEITEETVISVAEKEDFLIAMEIMDRVVRIVTEIGPARPQGEGRPARQGDGNGRPIETVRVDATAAEVAREDQDRAETEDRITEVKDALAETTVADREMAGGRRENDAVFTPELTKTSKDSKRERDRENKNKKKDFEKSGAGHNRPNQGGRRNLSRIPKALQKPTPQPKQEEKKPEVKEITLPEKMTIRELAEAMKMQPSVIVKKLFLEGTMVTVNHEIDFEKAAGDRTGL